MNKAIFLDRDGVINKRLIGDYVKSIEEFQILPKVRETIIELKNKGYVIIIITNQQGIGKGLMSKEDLEFIHKYMVKEIPEIDDIYYCPHLEGTCNCRKPKPGMLINASKKWNINFKNSWMIGDSESDILAGKSVGCKTIKIQENITKNTAGDYVVNNLYGALDIIL